jgi:hypothetical protein
MSGLPFAQLPVQTEKSVGTSSQGWHVPTLRPELGFQPFLPVNTGPTRWPGPTRQAQART